MERILLTASVIAMGAGGAFAGGIDRSGQSVAVIFEDGNYAEFSLGSVSPSVSGQAVAIPAPGLNSAISGDMAASYAQFSGAIKYKFSDTLDGALIFDQPFGANVDYPAGTAYYATGSTATLKTTAITGVLQYTMPSNVSVYGGLRYETMSAEASIPFVAGYTATGSKDGALGYLVGIAYEKPEIALRVALTYNSKIKHEIDTSEASLLGPLNTVTEVNSPESVNLEFQSGVAKDTLVFGSIRWVDWSNFDISPTQYGALTGGGSLVSYDHDTISYSIGVGRKFNEHWSAALTLGYEKQDGGIASNLGPTDGYKSIGLGATYTQDNMKISAGVRYVDIGDAQVQLGPVSPSANFTDNHAVGFGMRVGFSF
ncbi:MAG: outer membrane protein transport protein [Paracoccaceae bacterium]